MENALINIDLKYASKVANNLIDKISSATGWVFNHETLKGLALKTYIEDIQNSNLTPTEKAILISNAKKIIREFNNQKDIVWKAIDKLDIQARPEVVDNDWIAKFMDRSRLISDEEFQEVWSLVLARECSHPGSIPFNVISILDRMDRQNAIAFLALCRTKVQFGNECAPFVIGNKLREYEDYNIFLDDLIDLESLGLVVTSIGTFQPSFSLTSCKQEDMLQYFDHVFTGSYNYNDEEKNVCIGDVLFTRYGMALCKAIKVTEIEGFWEDFCLPYLQKQL